jgi:hypothetical protein
MESLNFQCEEDLLLSYKIVQMKEIRLEWEW